MGIKRQSGKYLPAGWNLLQYDRWAAGCVAVACCWLTMGVSAQAGPPSLAGTLPNPAMMGFALPGLTTEVSVTAVAGNTVIKPVSATNPNIPNLLSLGDSGNTRKLQFLPTSYSVFRAGDWAFGLTTSSPYTLQNLPRREWAGMVYARDWTIDTQNFTPQVTYRVAPWLHVGAGLQIQSMQVSLSQAFPQSPGSPDLTVKGDALNFGFALGVSAILPTRTVVGIGYRSAIDQKLEGTISRPSIPALGQPAVTVPVAFTLPMPDKLNVTVSQRLNEAWTVFATVEWARWSRFGDIAINATPAGLPGIPTVMPVRWRDAWTFMGVAEYRWNSDLALRAGVRFEQGSATDAVRMPTNPNDDRLRLLAGITYELNEKLSLDVNYVRNLEWRSPIDVSLGHPSYAVARGTFVGEATQSAHYVNLGLRYYWGRPGGI